MGMRVLVCGHEHFGYVKSIARGFRQLDRVESDAFTHPYVPVRKMRAASWLKRLWHSMKTRRINRKILERSQTGGYDLILCIEGGCMLPETVERIREKVKIALWCLDSLRLLNLDFDVLKAFTRVFFFEPTDLRIFREGSYLPIGFDPTIYQRLNPRKIMHDMIWIGSPHRDRLPKLDRIARFSKERGLDFSIYSRFFSKKAQKRELEIRYPFLLQAIRKNARISPGEANLLYNSSRIAVNLHLDDVHNQGINPRTLEVPGSGCFLLTDYRNEMAKLFDMQREMATFLDMDEFERKSEYYLTHEKEREDMADRGHRKVHRDHTFAARSKEMLNILARA
jgi:spore maturation protein CgeB